MPPEMCIWIRLLAPATGWLSFSRSWWSFGSVRHGRCGCPDGRPSPRYHRRRRRDLLHRQLPAAPRRKLAVPSLDRALLNMERLTNHRRVTRRNLSRSSTRSTRSSTSPADGSGGRAGGPSARGRGETTETSPRLYVLPDREETRCRCCLMSTVLSYWNSRNDGFALVYL